MDIFKCDEAREALRVVVEEKLKRSQYETLDVVADKVVDTIELALGDREPVSALDSQEGGSHYKGMKIQPIEYCFHNKLSYPVSNVIKYVSRYQDKNGIEDLKKAIHNIEILMEMEYGEEV